jgi:hypothetical protein
MCTVDNDSLTALFLFLTLAQGQGRLGFPPFTPFTHPKLQADSLISLGPFLFPFQTVFATLSKIFLPAWPKKVCFWKQKNWTAGGDPRKC